MKYFKIYGEKYELTSVADAPPDAYGYRNDLVDDIPKGAKTVGYVKMEDGSVIECLSKFNPAVIIAPLILTVAVAGGAAGYFLFFQEKDVAIPAPGGEVTVKEGVDTDMVSYNGFTELSEDTIDIQFQNGSEEATIVIIGEGINCEPVTVAPNELVPEIPATFNTKKGLVQAKLNIKTATSESEQNIIVEIPDNDTPSSSGQGMDGYWRGEAVYGQ